MNFAWENDKVAFRTYGPEAPASDKMADLRDGTLTAGIDCWMKRVDYPNHPIKMVQKHMAWRKLITKTMAKDHDPYRM